MVGLQGCSSNLVKIKIPYAESEQQLCTVFLALVAGLCSGLLFISLPVQIVCGNR